MIHFLKGIVAEVGDTYLAIDVNGVGYKVFASGRVLGRAAVGEAMKIHTYTYLQVMQEGQIALYGFADATERTVFEKLISVDGVGRKAALSILSALSLEEIADAIALQDGRIIARANGIGPKLGERVVRELKGKLGALPTADGARLELTGATGTAVSDVFSALTNLGYKPAQAQQAIKQAVKTAGETAGFDKLLKASLAQLQK